MAYKAMSPSNLLRAAIHEPGYIKLLKQASQGFLTHARYDEVRKIDNFLPHAAH